MGQAQKEREEKEGKKLNIIVPQLSEETIRARVGAAFDNAVLKVYGAPISSFDRKTKDNFSQIKNSILDLAIQKESEHKKTGPGSAFADESAKESERHYQFSLGADSQKFAREFKNALSKSIGGVLNVALEDDSIVVSYARGAKAKRVDGS